MILMVLSNSNVKKKSTIREKRRKFALLVQITTKGTVAYTKKKGHTTVSMFIVVLFVKVSAHE